MSISCMSLDDMLSPRLFAMKTSAREVLANNIRELRKQRGWSQDELADQAGVHRTYVGTVERCEQSITIDSLEKLANAFGVSPARLLEE